MLLLGNPDPAFDIYNVYKKRVEDRVARSKQQLTENDFDFSKDESIELNRQKAPWPKDRCRFRPPLAPPDQGEYLQEKLARSPARRLAADSIDSPVKVLTRRYDQLLLNLHEQTMRMCSAISSPPLALTYDPAL